MTMTATHVEGGITTDTPDAAPQPVLKNPLTGKVETRAQRKQRLLNVAPPEDHKLLALLDKVARAARTADAHNLGLADHPDRVAARQFVKENADKVQQVPSGSYAVDQGRLAVMSGRGHAWVRGQSSLAQRCRALIAGTRPGTEAQIAKARQLEAAGKLMPVPKLGNVIPADEVWAWLRRIKVVGLDYTPERRSSPGSPRGPRAATTAAKKSGKKAETAAPVDEAA